MKKKIFIILLAFIAVFCFSFAFTACGSQPPPVAGADGKDGEDGKGIEDITVNADGELVITYTDGTAVNLGKVKGEDGADGEKGETGATGKEISYIYFNARNELNFKFNDNTVINLGKIEGTGRDGRGILDVSFNIDKELVITYTDGQKTNLGKIEGIHGSNGSNGRGILRAEFNSENELIIIYTDGTQENLGKIAVEGGACAHEYTVWNEMLAPSCASIGYDARTCTKCGITDYNIFPSTGHEFGEGKVFTEPTCTQDGLTLYICKTCGTVKAEEPQYKGHKFADGVCTACGKDIADSEGLEYELNEDGKSYSVTGRGSNRDNAIIVPSSYRGLPVTAISEGAFRESAEITEVTVPSSVSEISGFAFAFCAKLNKITLSEGLRTIGDNAFYGCAYTGITIPGTVVYIGLYAFSSIRPTLKTAVFQVKSGWTCTAYNNGAVVAKNVINSASLSSSSSAANLLNDEYFIASLGILCGYIWTRSNSLQFELNDDLESYTVNGIGSLTDLDVVIPSSYNGLPVTAIAENAFRSKVIRSVYIPNSVTVIGRSAFNNCPNLERVEICGSVTEIQSSTFTGCESLTEIILPDSLTVIGVGAFAGCESLTEINLPDGLQTIDFLAFGKMPIKYIVIPASVTSIGQRVFLLCDELVGVEFENKTGWVRTALYGNEVVDEVTVNEEDLTDAAKTLELFNKTFFYEDSPSGGSTCYYSWQRTENE